MHINFIKTNNNYGEIMDYLERIKKDFNNYQDLIIKDININNNILTIISIETITTSTSINDFILRNIKIIDKNIKEYLYNNLPCISIKEINNYNDLINLLVNGFTIILINNKEILAIETILNLSRGIPETNYEKSITGPKDSFNEHFNTNIGLIRKRIKNNNLKLETITIGRYTNTKIGIMYQEGIYKPEIKEKIINKLKNINIDGILDSSYLKKYLTNSHSLFPTIKETERPDLASQAILEGKIVIITDNSPNVLILPSFFIDFFHTSDDYYQKHINITFIRIIRLIAFIIAIILPSYYIAITTYNVNFIPINLLINFIAQRTSVPFPSFIEAGIMILSFEILRESDVRIPIASGTAISILGGLVLGDAAVAAGIISPIMIIVIAISMISSLVFQSIEIINAIRYYRFILIILTSFLGLYGIFIGSILIIANLANTNSFNEDYLYPFAPINLLSQQDGFIKTNPKVLLRNPTITDNHIRGIK